jgi:large repetitive protein
MKTIQENLKKLVLSTAFCLSLLLSTNSFAQPVCIDEKLEHDFPSGIAVLGCDVYSHTLWSNSGFSIIKVIHPSQSNRVFNLSVEDYGTGLRKIIVPKFENGNWVSKDTVSTSDQIFIEPVSEGKATIAYSTAGPDCFTQNTSRVFEVVSNQISKPDVLTAYTNIIASGNVSTNDANIPNMKYDSIPTLLSSPNGSTATLTINKDGSYSFVSNLKGTYIYNLYTCRGSCCTQTTLTIHVIDNYTLPKVIAKTDYITTLTNSPIALSNLVNDKCLSSGNCQIDPSSISFIVNAKNGNLSIVNGKYVYTPNANYIGLDSIFYKVCSTGNTISCDSAMQYISIQDSFSNNSTTAVDDFVKVNQDSVLIGNVLLNDSDAQGDNQTVTPKSETINGCTFNLLTDGSFMFTPAAKYSGIVSYTYKVCDDNALNVQCANATITFAVMPTIALKVRVYLEGSLMNSSGIASDGRPLMRDNLRVSPFNSKRIIPLKDPYQYAVNASPTYVYDLSATPQLINRYKEIACGTYAKFGVIPDSTIFNITGQNAIVDWIFVELRDKNDNKKIVATRSGLLQRDGDIVDLDGKSALAFPDVEADNYYIAIKHRNHLSVMSKSNLQPTVYITLVDFTKPSLQTYDIGIVNGNNYRDLGQKYNVKPGYNSMWAGDFNSDGILKADASNDEINTLVNEVLLMSEDGTYGLNFDKAIGYLGSDYNMNSKARFDNPHDDKNMLYGQVLFYPLNYSLLSNFYGFFEQLP